MSSADQSFSANNTWTAPDYTPATKETDTPKKVNGPIMGTPVFNCQHGASCINLECTQIHPPGRQDTLTRYYEDEDPYAYFFNK